MTNQSLLVKGVVVNYDLVDDEVLQEMAYRRLKYVKLGDDEQTMRIARKAHVQVWRDFDVLETAWLSVWSDENARRYKRKLLAWGLTEDDADDVISSIALYTFSSFEMWRPWDASFNTWFYSVGRHMQKSVIERMRRRDVSVEDVLLHVEDGEEWHGKASLILDAISTSPIEELDLDNPSTVIIQKLIASLRENPDYKAQDAAEILEHAIVLGDAFKSLNQKILLDSVGMTASQVNYRLQTSGVKELAKEIEKDLSVL